MPTITLPDGSQRSFDHSVSILDVASDIGPGLAKATLAGVINGKQYDASHQIDDDIELSIITTNSEEGVELSLIHI